MMLLILFSSSNHINVHKKYSNVLQYFRESVRFSSTSWVRARSCVFTCGSIGANFGQKFAHFAFKLLNFISNIDACCFLRFFFLVHFIILFFVGFRCESTIFLSNLVTQHLCSMLLEFRAFFNLLLIFDIFFFQCTTLSIYKTKNLRLNIITKSYVCGRFKGVMLIQFSALKPCIYF